MGQTLTHGIYLPDEGERNCYNGLAANWQLLDGAVGTIAEHTTALAGKAPAVHTHTKADITDFPAYGNTAGTICEGNDSRLSDARTPVAHTHTKSDVTDLFNSANTWTGNNSYTGIVSLDSSSDVAEQFKQKLPKDVSASNDSMARVNALVDSAGHYVVVETIGHWSNYVAKNITLKYKNDSAKQRAVEFRLYSDGSGIFYAQSPFACDLGNAYNKWKSLNGINPGALSLPTTDTSKLVYFSGEITDLTGGLNSKSFAMDGWITIFMPNVSGDFIAIDTSIGQVISISGTGVGDANIGCICPVRAGVTNRIYCKCSGGSLTAACAPCEGNV